MLLSAVSVLVVAQSISEIPEGLMNNPVYNTKDTITTKVMTMMVINFGLKLEEYLVMGTITSDMFVLGVYWWLPN
jgi:hypothetical protein